MRFRFPVLLLVLVGLLSGCSKDDEITTPTVCEEGLTSVAVFAASDTLTYTELDDTGMLYHITDPGTAERPTLQSTVTAHYRGFVTNGRVFDQTTPSTGPVDFPLSGVIQGWQLGVPLIGKGGKIRLLIPASLGYGSTGSCRMGVCTICPDSDLVFDIELVDFTN
ncbi:FKBP-type peptidyl-prolyl cis-trans isomerase [Lewinella aquimaris]|uniref:Peptidyl-prolyl cis-trans isomerase n=1 Tax=Neolewinella aquimaris TaxID=1835722 RepID=A0A840EA09_9BACT|nr:FKBP-type peptidyl-prolyl cis-trans isomerase [Neolewinella aquimaris]MBB4080562.1 FKBP-type peptidyl-prolyl cis-trans isomerase [Neolewinella aquimaris]